MAHRDESVITDVDLNTIPKSTEHLQLKFPNDLQSFVTLIPNEPLGLYPNLNVDLELIRIADLLPNLKRLELSGTVGDMPLNMQSLQNLPSTLTTFSCKRHIQLSVDSIKLLPRSLTDLRIRLGLGLATRDIDATTFPPTLAKLSLGNFQGEKPLFQHLPRSLTDLKATLLSGRYLAEDWKFLPPNLTRLVVTLYHFSKEWATAAFREDDGSLNGAAKLASLLVLDVKGIHMARFDLDAIKLLPRELKSFSATLYGNFGSSMEAADQADKFMKNLPTSVTELNLGRAPLPLELVYMLPRGIKRFYAGRTSLLGPRTPGLWPLSTPSMIEHISTLPPSITQLQLELPFLTDADSLKCLPKTLTSISIELSQDGIQETMSGMSRFPWLRILTLSLARIKFPANALYELPSSISDLHVRARLKATEVDLAQCRWSRQLISFVVSKPLSDGRGDDSPDEVWWNNVEDVETESTQSERFYSGLPRTLKKLLLKNGTKISVPSASSLPPSLVALALTFSDHAADYFFSSLPRSLEVLEITAPSAGLSEETLDNLPFGLRDITLPYQPSIGINRYRQFLTDRALGYLYFSDDLDTIPVDVVSGTPSGIRNQAHSFPNNLHYMKDPPEWFTKVNA
jgi:hypothetical protein